MAKPKTKPSPPWRTPSSWRTRLYDFDHAVLDGDAMVVGRRLFVFDSAGQEFLSGRPGTVDMAAPCTPARLTRHYIANALKACLDFESRHPGEAARKDEWLDLGDCMDALAAR